MSIHKVFDGKLFRSYNIYVTEESAKIDAIKLRKEGFRVRTTHSKLDEAPYVILWIRKREV